jgi:heme A synthase
VALGDTLFPVASLREGFAQDLSSTAHAFVRLRTWHPALALAMAVVVVALAGWVRRQRGGDAVQRWARTLVVLFAAQLGVGLVNLALQLVHLVMADLVWIALVLLTAAALAPEARGAARSAA